MRNTELARGRLERPPPVVPNRRVPEKPKKRTEPLVFVILGLVVLAVMIVVLIWKAGEWSRAPDRDMESRVQQMEQRLAKLDGLDRRISQLERKSGERSLLLMERMDRIEKSLAALREYKTDEKKVAPPKREAPPKPPEPAKPAEPIKPAKPAKASEPPKAAGEAVYHQVLEGETLYRISRNYGLSVDELLQMNDLPPGSTIRKGQRLRVGPPRTR